MANKNVFKGSGSGSGRGVKLVPTNTVNVAGGRAYDLGAEAELAQLAGTGMLNDTFYTSADQQVNRVLELAAQASPEFLAKLAVYSREEAFLKDMPALLCAVLFGKQQDVLLKKIFLKVVDNGRMLRNFVQIVRSGVTGRKSLGTFGKKLVQSYFDSKSPDALFRDSVGNDPSLADVIKLAHPRPTDATRQALYRYLIGKTLDSEQLEALPALVKDFESFKLFRNNGIKTVPELAVPNVPFQMLTSLNLTPEDWTSIALAGNWHFTRMNLNTFARHEVLKNRDVVKTLAAKLRDPVAIEKAKVFPYQLLVAYLNVDPAVPKELHNALQDAMEVATQNVPKFEAENILVFPDVSGSMSGPVASNGVVSSKVTYNDVAALFSAAILRKNEQAEVVPFDTRVHKATLNARDSVMTNAQLLRKFGGGGTSCSVALYDANQRKVKADLVIYVSDNASWFDGNGGTWGSHDASATMVEWRNFKRRNPKAKMVCINIAPYGTTQAANSPDILNIGGFSDSIFDTINNFVNKRDGKEWVSVIEKVKLD